jgi:hypothetical protein
MEVNPKTAWWLEHKDEPRVIASMREARRKYYYKNHEQEKARALEAYHKRKALLNPPTAAEQIPENGGVSG